MIYYKGEDFDNLISKGNYLVDFYADWCGPCKMLGSVLETINDIEIIKVNVDEYPSLASRFKIMSIPHLKFFNDGKEIDHIVGFVDKETIEEKVMELNNLQLLYVKNQRIL